ncbi:MAG: domain containing protein [Actinoallomurus sp.]|nr:domain containing protein [Actinoallomurus sp.]
MSEAHPPYGRIPDYDEPAPVEELSLAPILRRAGARVIDAGLLGIVGFAVILPFMIAAVGLDEPGSHANDGGGVWSGTAVVGWILVVAILPFAYEALQLAVWGQTLGKRIFSLRVLAETGEVMPPAQAVGRAAINNVVYLLGCGIGTIMAYLWAIWDEPLHQALHDRLAGTVVVDDREYADE